MVDLPCHVLNEFFLEIITEAQKRRSNEEKIVEQF